METKDIPEQEIHNRIIGYLQAINKSTDVFESKWKSDDLLTREVLRLTPAFWYKKYGWNRSEIEELFNRAKLIVDSKYHLSLDAVFGGKLGNKKLKQNQKSKQMKKNGTTSVTMKCDNMFSTCPSANRIKLVLNQYNKIAADKQNKSDQYLQIEVNKLLTNISANGTYSNVELLNDLYHIKYMHNTNEDAQQFNVFYKYLFDGDNVLQCDINECQSVKKYYSRRERSRVSSNINIKTGYSWYLVCRIHTYFIHSHDISQLTPDEIQYIEQQLIECKEEDPNTLDDKKIELISTIMKKKRKNASIIFHSLEHNRFLTADRHLKQVNIDEIFVVLQRNNIPVNKNELQSTFEHYSYNRQELVDDLCVILVKETEKNVLLADILINDLKFNDVYDRKVIYGIICHEHIMRNCHNFITVLQMTASKLITDVNIEEIAIIAFESNLTSMIFDKANKKEFKNSTKFSLIFKNMKNWNKKQWAKVYTTMNKWKNPKPAINLIQESKPLTVITDICVVNDKIDTATEEQKYSKDSMSCNDADMEYINTQSDDYIFEKFCRMTNAEKNVALPCLNEAKWNFREALNKWGIIEELCMLTGSYEPTEAIELLREAEWNIVFAVNKYYGANISRKTNNTTDSAAEDIDTTDKIYNHGISFWYWDNNDAVKQCGKRIVNKKFDCLKNEILQFNKFTPKIWNDLIDECHILGKTDKVREISTNDWNAETYNIVKGSSISIGHLCSIKLYTDFSWLCKIFCEAFRVKKISENQYERIISVQRRNEKIANWAKLLVETVQCFGKFMTGKRKYYRGIDMEFVFKRFITRFNVPLSTTIDFAKAAEFAEGGNGLVIQLRRYNQYMSGFDCSIISDFDREKEILFFGSDSIFHIRTIYQWYNKKWTSYKKYIDQIQGMLDIANGSIQWRNANNMKDVIGHLLNQEYHQVYFDNKALPPYIEKLLNYHLQNISNTVEYDFEHLSKHYEWVRDIFVGYKNIPNLLNACNLFPNCDNIRFNMAVYHSFNAESCSEMTQRLFLLNNKNVCIEFTWSVPKDLWALAGHFNALSDKHQSLTIDTRVDGKTNSVFIKLHWSQIREFQPKRVPKEDPGDGLLTTVPSSIVFKWNKNMKVKKSCDTLHMLYLLQLALELVRLRTIERNKYFKSIGRTDRFINHLNPPSIITNLLEWHRNDPIENKFDGELLEFAKKEKLFMINQIISDIGGVKKGPATKIYTKLMKDVVVETTTWLELPQPVLKLEVGKLPDSGVFKFVIHYFRTKIEPKYNIFIPPEVIEIIIPFLCDQISYYYGTLFEDAIHGFVDVDVDVVDTDPNSDESSSLLRISK